MPPILVFLIGIAVLMVLCVVFKVNAFISLLVTALVFGALTGMGGVEIVETITTGFAGTVESIGIVIIFGIMLGNYLDASKATNRMALDTVRLVGQKRSGIAMSICGYIISIPVFSDAAMVILTPLVKSIHKRTRIPLAILAVSLASGLLATHVYVPPTPGPLAAAGLLGIDIGEAILYGAFAAVFMTLFGTVFAHLFFKNKPDSYYSWRDDTEQKEEKEISDGKDLMDDKDLPGTLASILPLVLPLILIVGNTTCSMLLPEDSIVVAITSFIGDANVALAIGALLAVVFLGKRMGKDTVMKVVDKSLKEAGPIVFITAAGGSLGEVLSVSGAGADLASMVINTGLPFILIPFVISAILKIVQGSGTVAVTTAANGCGHDCGDAVCSDCIRTRAEPDPDLHGIRCRRKGMLPCQRQLLLGVHELYGLRYEGWSQDPFALRSRHGSWRTVRNLLCKPLAVVHHRIMEIGTSTLR